MTRDFEPSDLKAASADISRFLSERDGEQVSVIASVETDLYPLVVPIDGLIFDPYQSQEHDERSIEEITKSFRDHGQKTPLLVERATNYVKKGNGSLEAVKALGWTHIAAVRSDDIEEALRLYALRDNRTGQFAKWIGKKVVEELGALEADSADVGWTEEELAALSTEPRGGGGNDPGPQTNRAEELQKEWGTELGQLWALGEHRLLCGDCTVDADVERLLSGKKPTAMLTDPPYGMGENRIRDGCKRGRENAAAEWDDEVFDIRKLPVRKYKTLIWGAQFYGGAPLELGLMTWSCWDKRTREMGSVRHGALELCCANFGKSQVWPIMWGPYQSVRQDVPHPTSKPVELIKETVILATEPGEAVFDPFLGSGTTLIACEQLNRRCYAIEISPAYVAVTLQRYLDATGKRPELIEP